MIECVCDGCGDRQQAEIGSSHKDCSDYDGVWRQRVPPEQVVLSSEIHRHWEQVAQSAVSGLTGKDDIDPSEIPDEDFYLDEDGELVLYISVCDLLITCKLSRKLWRWSRMDN